MQMDNKMDNNKIKAKNIKKYYVPRTVVVYFSESGLTVSENLSKLVVEYTKFIQIGSSDVTHQRFDHINNFNSKRFNKDFYNWSYSKRDGSIEISKSSSFFSSAIGKKLINEIAQYDIAIIVYKSSQETSLEYVDHLVSICAKKDVFTFHYPIETFISRDDVAKTYRKLINSFTKKRQIYVPIKEKSIVSAFTHSTISSRNYYINLYINNLIESFLSPFLDPVKNPDHFSRVKALFYQSRKNFESRAITTMGYSDDKVDCLDVSLIKALSNPLFNCAFDAAKTFLVSIKAPFLTEEMLKKINYALKTMIGADKQYLISTYIGAYDFEVYCQISIMAINVDESKLISNTYAMEERVKEVLKEASEKNNILMNSETKEMLLENKIGVIDEQNIK